MKSTFLSFFLGPQHAKGPCDPAGATFKYIVNRKVKSFFPKNILYSQVIPEIRQKVDEKGFEFPYVNRDFLSISKHIRLKALDMKEWRKYSLDLFQVFKWVCEWEEALQPLSQISA